jgi:hypothetical protein
MNNRDLVPQEIGLSPNFLMMDHPGAAWGRTGLITAGHGGARRRGYRQHCCYSGDDHLYITHGGLPDKGRQK